MAKFHWKRNTALITVITISIWQASAQTATTNLNSQDLRGFVPDTISPQAHAIFDKMLPLAIAGKTHSRTLRHLQISMRSTKKMWRVASPRRRALAKALGVTNVDMKLGGVGVLETEPANYRDDGTVLIRVHGGGFFLGSARSSAGGDAQMAVATGKRILSVDYTVHLGANGR